MGLLRFQRDSAIVILVGDNGAVAVNIVGGTVQGKYFVSRVQDESWDEVQKCVCSNRDTRIYVMLDHSCQVYSRHEASAVGKLTAKSVVKKRSLGIVCDGGFSTSFLVSAMNKENESQYMFVESDIEDNLYKSIMGLVSKYASGGRFKGVLLFSMELAKIAMSVASQESKEKTWVVFLVYTKVGDFRQIVLCKGELFSSSVIMVTPSEREQPCMMAGKIYQCVQDVIKEISTSCGKQSSDDIALYMVVPGSVKSSLLSFDLQKEDISVFTPYELGKVFGIQDCVSVGSSYCDTVVVYAMVQRGEFQHIMHTHETLSESRSRKLKLFAIFPTFVAIAITGLLYTLNAVELLKTRSITYKLGSEFAELTRELKNIREDQEFTKINEMYDVVDLYRSLSHVSSDPIDVLVLLSKVNRDDFRFTSFSWSAVEDFEVNVILGISVPGGKLVDWNEVFGDILGDYKIVDVSTVDSKPEKFVMRIERRYLGKD